MSDTVYILNLPPRYLSSMAPEVEYNSCTLIGGLLMSGIATSARLRFWQDDISKQVFWADGGIGGYGGDDFEFSGSGKMTDIEQWGYWGVSPSRFPQIANMIMGWGAMWSNSISKAERRELIRDVREALKTSPSDDQIYSYYRFNRYPNEVYGPHPFVQWWS